MKDKIKNWLGIADLENRVGKKKVSPFMFYLFRFDGENSQTSLSSDVNDIYNRLGKIEDYLNIEYEEKEIKGYKKKNKN